MPEEKEPFKILVTASALKEILEALRGPGYMVRELQALRSLGESPIDLLVDEYSSQVTAYNLAVRKKVEPDICKEEIEGKALDGSPDSPTTYRS